MTDVDYKILIVDDEEDIIEFVSYNLRREGYHVFSAINSKDAITIAKEVVPHLIILDVMLPDMDGIDTCIELRKMDSLADTIIVFLTARAEDYSQIAGLEAGGDDYITKPIRPRILLSRIKAWLRRTRLEKASGHVLSLKDITIDKDRYLVIKNGQEIALARKEFELLGLLTSKPNKVYTRDEIFTCIWAMMLLSGIEQLTFIFANYVKKQESKTLKPLKELATNTKKYEIYKTSFTCFQLGPDHYSNFCCFIFNYLFDI